jgi:hypothetical protein
MPGLSIGTNARAQLTALREVVGIGIVLRFGQVAGDQQHFQRRHVVGIGEAGAEGNAQQHDAVEQAREKQGRGEPIPDRRVAFFERRIHGGQVRKWARIIAATGAARSLP